MTATIEIMPKQLSMRERIEEFVDLGPLVPTTFDQDGSKRRIAIIEQMEHLVDELALPYPDLEIYDVAERTVDLALAIRRVEILNSLRPSAMSVRLNRQRIMAGLG
jgi:hypothetical protein